MACAKTWRSGCEPATLETDQFAWGDLEQRGQRSQAIRSAICSARRSAAARPSPMATMTERWPRRSRTSQARLIGRPRELADPRSTSTLIGWALSFVAAR